MQCTSSRLMNCATFTPVICRGETSMAQAWRGCGFHSLFFFPLCGCWAGCMVLWTSREDGASGICCRFAHVKGSTGAKEHFTCRVTRCKFDLRLNKTVLFASHLPQYILKAPLSTRQSANCFLLTSSTP